MKFYRENDKIVIDFKDIKNESKDFKYKLIKLQDVKNENIGKPSVKVKNALRIGNIVFLKNDLKNFLIFGTILTGKFIVLKEFLNIINKLKKSKEKEDFNDTMSDEEKVNKLKDFYNEKGYDVLNDEDKLVAYKLNKIDNDKVHFNMLKFKPLVEKEKK